MIVIGLDFGMKSWGCALGIQLTEHTEPLGAISAVNGTIDYSQLDRWISEYNVDALIIGVPSKQDGTPFYTTKHAQNAFEMLQERYSIPIYQVDEHMTSVEARDELFKSKGKKALSKSNVDVRSAQLIIERWFSLHLK
jgi:putative Holliday junction resolvase